ncbi:MAG TPA: hypothetical protein VFS90_18990 [Pyrinomonadaceae bacterium]|nr:hypothetical protein [Pyrinomonadaceae bacterium]
MSTCGAALVDLHLGATMVVMIHRNFRSKEGRIKPSQRFRIKAQSGFVVGN